LDPLSPGDRGAGHTDTKGAAAYNKRLSDRRATAVMKYLVTHGIDSGSRSHDARGRRE
jgi:outer membrane protein OmpA-like peptidoglycan-associated protein